ncbi:hypothetical protein D3C83_154130 [compost metagenome]
MRLMSSSMRRYARSVATMMSELDRSSATTFVTWRSEAAGAALVVLPPAAFGAEGAEDPDLTSNRSLSCFSISDADA